MSRTQLIAQFFRLKGGVTSLTGVKHSGQPSMSSACENVDQVKEPVYKHGRITIQETSDMLEIIHDRVPSIFKDNQTCISCYQIQAPTAE